MDGVEYRVIITGELIEGCDVNEVVERLAALFKQPIDTMARLFGQRPIPINTPYPAAKAEKVQQHLHSIGALTRLEPVKPAGLSLQQPVGSGEAQASEEPEGFSCPKCGEAQTPSERCSHCGVIFAKLQGQTATSSEPHEARDERLDEALFIGNNSERYLEQFRKFRRSRRHDFAVTWHWPALLVPFYWATYRKMWGWSVVMLLSGVLWPFSSLLWAMTANHLYFGHMNKRLALVRNKCRGRSAEEVEERIMQAGGTSPIGLLVGIALSVFIGYHYVSSITAVLNEQVAEAQAAIAEDRMPQGVVKTPQGTSTFMNMTVLTIGLKLAAAEADSGLEPGMDIEAVGSKLQLPAQSLKDGWGRMMALRIEHAGFTLASAGPDGEFETADDMVMYRDLE